MTANRRAVGSNFARGVAMGSADVVPGVSGGTIALLFGIYEQLVGAIQAGSISLARFLRGDMRGGLDGLRQVDWWFLVPLVAGEWVTITALAGVIEHLLTEYPEEMAGLFLGLVAASILIASRMLAVWNPSRIGLAASVAAAVFLVLGISGDPVVDPSSTAFFAAGVVAVCAWILPGISGAFLLLMLGMYSPVINAIDDRVFSDLAAIALGGLVGLAGFSIILRRLLERHRDTMLAALIGLMLGSARVLWPWPDGVGSVSRDMQVVSGTGMSWPTGSGLWPPLLLAAASFALVVGFDFRAHRASDRA